MDQNDERELREEQKRQRYDTDQKARGGTRTQRKAPDDKASGKDDDTEHDRCFEKLGRAHAKARHQERHSHGAEKEAGAEDKGEVRETSFQYVHAARGGKSITPSAAGSVPEEIEPVGNRPEFRLDN